MQLCHNRRGGHNNCPVFLKAEIQHIGHDQRVPVLKEQTFSQASFNIGSFVRIGIQRICAGNLVSTHRSKLILDHLKACSVRQSGFFSAGYGDMYAGAGYHIERLFLTRQRFLLELLRLLNRIQVFV